MTCFAFCSFAAFVFSVVFTVPLCNGVFRSSAVYAFVMFWHLYVIVRGWRNVIQILGVMESGCVEKKEWMPCTYITPDLRNFYLVLESWREIENECEIQMRHLNLVDEVKDHDMNIRGIL